MASVIKVDQIQSDTGTVNITSNLVMSSTVTRDGAAVQKLNRTTSDGTIAEFQKNGTTVGNIGTPFAGELYIEGSGTNSSGLLFTSGNTIQPRKNSAADDGNISIGTSGNRFKDLYLSGGVYVGGTTSANYLNDYEEGTWTPVINGYTGGYTLQAGYYTKIGNMVFAHFTINTDGNGGSITNPYIQPNTPFAGSSSSSNGFGGIFGFAGGIGTLSANSFGFGPLDDPGAGGSLMFGNQFLSVAPGVGNFLSSQVNTNVVVDFRGMMMYRTDS